MTNDAILKTSASFERIAKEGPQVKADFSRAHANEQRPEIDAGHGSEQVEKDQPVLKPQPTLGFGTAELIRSSHWSTAVRNHERTTQGTLEARKQAFLDRLAAKERDGKGKDTGRGVE